MRTPAGRPSPARRSLSYSLGEAFGRGRRRPPPARLAAAVKTWLLAQIARKRAAPSAHSAETTPEPFALVALCSTTRAWLFSAPGQSLRPARRKKRGSSRRWCRSPSGKSHRCCPRGRAARPHSHKAPSRRHLVDDLLACVGERGRQTGQQCASVRTAGIRSKPGRAATISAGSSCRTKTRAIRAVCRAHYRARADVNGGTTRSNLAPTDNRVPISGPLDRRRVAGVNHPQLTAEKAMKRRELFGGIMKRPLRVRSSRRLGRRPRRARAG